MDGKIKQRHIYWSNIMYHKSIRYIILFIGLITSSFFSSLGSEIPKTIEISEKMNWEYMWVTCVWDHGSRVLAFKDKDTSKIYSLKFVNETLKGDKYPLEEGQVVEIQVRASEEEKSQGKNTPYVIIPSDGKMQKEIVHLVNKAILLSSDEIDIANMKNCIEILQNRNQPWEKVRDKFKINPKAYKIKD